MLNNDLEGSEVTPPNQTIKKDALPHTHINSQAPPSAQRALAHTHTHRKTVKSASTDDCRGNKVGGNHQKRTNSEKGSVGVEPAWGRSQGPDTLLQGQRGGGAGARGQLT